ncbi:MAG TPA: hypothetical protein VH255_05140 [Verrucomicrobiae bacterium]|nr:hypothetical protein [Verrucomicrobiae bacterium]
MRLLSKIIVFSLLLIPAMVNAQSFSIDWFTIDGGGGTSSGGQYSVSGTIGQPDAGLTMVGGNYTVDGGFWAFAAAIQTLGSPTLLIVPSGAGQATISWSPNSPGFVLQETTSISPTNWVNSASGSANPIAVPAAVPTKFYRLIKP